MGYVIYKIQNVSSFSEEQPTIEIDENSPEWNQALKKWKDGKNPTESKLWNLGVFALTKSKMQVELPLLQEERIPNSTRLL